MQYSASVAQGGVGGTSGGTGGEMAAARELAAEPRARSYA